MHQDHVVTGTWVQIDQVRLYNAGKIAEIQRLRSQAAKSLGGTGALGVFGAPGLAFAAEAVAVSVIAAILTSASQKQAADSLVEAQIKYERLIAAGGTDMPVSNIENIEIAAPGLWKARANGSDWLHSGDEFVNIVTPQAPFSVRWADVSLFHPQWPDAA